MGVTGWYDLIVGVVVEVKVVGGLVSWEQSKDRGKGGQIAVNSNRGTGSSV